MTIEQKVEVGEEMNRKASSQYPTTSEPREDANDHPRERPILFSAPMVRALLDGRKTQTRRMVKPQPTGVLGLLPEDSKRYPAWWFSGGPPPFASFEKRCPYGVPGDRLWVRETWRMPDTFDGDSPAVAASRVGNGFSPNVFYEADASVRSAGAYTGHPGKTRVSIHMPRWASRITLRVTDVRVERLNEISVADCYAEGCFRPDPTRILGSEVTIRDNARGEYRRIWEHINGPGSWDANPWVWVVSFQRITAPNAVREPQANTDRIRTSTGGPPNDLTDHGG